MTQQEFPTREEFARELDQFEEKQSRMPGKITPMSNPSHHDRFWLFIVAFGLIAAGCLVVAVAILG